MSIALLDVNVLVALFDAAHIDHEDAHHWFARNRKYGWATCPITINGCVRVLSSPAYPSVDTSPSEMVTRLRLLCSMPDHHCWEDSVSLTDNTIFRVATIAGHQKITDVYLIGLAVRNHGGLATLDRHIPVKAVPSATNANLVLRGKT